MRSYYFTRKAFLSTPSARRATHNVVFVGECNFISIHALREEGDTVLFRICAVLCNFYPRPPRGGRQSASVKPPWPILFLSTPSARRATHLLLTDWRYKTYFYPRPPRGGRRLFLEPLRHGCPISIHALREEGDYFSAMAAAHTV